jgi:hypothetical protein
VAGCFSKIYCLKARTTKNKIEPLLFIELLIQIADLSHFKSILPFFAD